MNFRPPFRLKKIHKDYANKKISLLDVGCGDHSATITKKIFPLCDYYGVDKGNYNNSKTDFGLMKKFYDVDLVKDDLHSIPDNFFDVIFFTHVIEHLPNGLDVIEKLTAKLKPGGKIYIEFPSIRSLFLPSAIRKNGGVLHFCDDPTHIRVYSISEVANVLLKEKMKIIKAGKARYLLNASLAIFFLPLQAFYYLKDKKCSSRFGFWSLLGVADYVYAEKRTL